MTLACVSIEAGMSFGAAGALYIVACAAYIRHWWRKADRD